MNWSIPTDRLIDRHNRRHRGGKENIHGIAYQDAYICLKLIALIDESREVLAVRPEGAQDVDLLYFDGREEYIQLKGSPDVRYTLDSLGPIIQRFAIDLLESGRKSTLAFTLVARSNNIDLAVSRLRNGKQSPDDINYVAKLLAKSQQDYIDYQPLVQLSDTERFDLVQQLLRQTNFLFGLGDSFEGKLSFESHACMELAKYGVAASELQDAFESLQSDIYKQPEFTRYDIEEKLKRFVGGAAIDLFEGSAQMLTDELFSHPASPERIWQFYTSARLDWDIISADCDIKRDQQSDLISLLTQPFEALRLVCLVGEPGSGKSTMARRVAADLHQRYNALVIRIKHKEDADVWYHMPNYFEKVKIPFYVLIDDVFREPDVVSALCEIDQSLPITILATSRLNEYCQIPFKGLVEMFQLKEPSNGEKEQILGLLGKTRNDLTLAQQRRMDSANQFLVLMIELTDPDGRDLEQIIQDTVNRMLIHNKYLYRAYEYVCFTYQYGISFPTSLLERLDSKGCFHNIPEHPAAQGLIFYDEDLIGNILVGHPTIAEIADRSYLRSRTSVLNEIIGAIDVSNNLERLFAGYLIRALGKKKSPICMSAFPQIDAFICSCKQYATISDLNLWRIFYKELEQHERVKECEDAALALVPIRSQECGILLHLYRERKCEGDVLPVIAKWVNDHPDDRIARVPYLGLLERYGDEEEIKRVLHETRNWLAKYTDNTSVRERYIGMMERNGNTEDIEAMINETRTWLSGHTAEKVIWISLIPTLIRLGRSQEALEVVSDAISFHPNEKNLIEQYLRLTRKSADEEVVRKLMEDKITKNPNDINAQIEFSNWLRDHGYDEEAEIIYKKLILTYRGKTKKSLEAKIYFGYGMLLMKSERYLEAMDQFRQITLRLNKEHQLAHSWLATALRYVGNLAMQEGRESDAFQYFTAAEKEFCEAIHWATVKNLPQAIFYTNLGWLYIDWKQYSKAAESFRLSISKDPNYFGGYWGLGKAQMELGRFQMAEDALCMALEKGKEDIKPPASIEIPQLLQQCRDCIRSK